MMTATPFFTYELPDTYPSNRDWKAAGRYDVAKFQRWIDTMGEAMIVNDPLAWAVGHGYCGA
jgi:hypothetical protein